MTTDQEIINWLGVGIGVVWSCKIGFHFVYLKSVDKSIRESNFVLFYLNIENIFTSVLLISPFFIARSATEDKEIGRKRWKARVSVYVLWAMFILTGIFSY